MDFPRNSARGIDFADSSAFFFFPPYDVASKEFSSPLRNLLVSHRWTILTFLSRFPPSPPFVLFASCPFFRRRVRLLFPFPREGWSFPGSPISFPSSLRGVSVSPFVFLTVSLCVPRVFQEIMFGVSCLRGPTRLGYTPSPSRKILCADDFLNSRAPCAPSPRHKRVFWVQKRF